MVLDAHPAYWGGAPRSSRLVFLETGPDGAEAMLGAQTIDVALLDTAPDRPSGVLSVPGWRVGYLALQTEKEPFNRVKARQAVAAALDPAQIAPAVGSVGVPLLSFLPLGVWGRRDRGPVMEGNAASAKRLLADAGFPRGSRQACWSPTPRSDWTRRGSARRSAPRWPPSASRCRSRPSLRMTVLQLARNGQHQMAVLEARVEAGDPHFLLYPLSSSEGASKGANAFNMSFYRNRTLDDLLIRASQVSFSPERQRLYARAQGILAEEVPWVPLYVRLHYAAARPEVRNLRLHPSGNPRLDRVWIDQATTPATPAPGSR